jgi:hypothetical protein
MSVSNLDMSVRRDKLSILGYSLSVSHFYNHTSTEQAMSQAEIDQWKSQAEALGLQTQNPLRIPYLNALEEAAGAGGFIVKYWNAANGLPGLSRTEKRLPFATSDEIISLIKAVQAQQTNFLLLVDPLVIKHGERANEVINKLESVLTFTLDDDIEEPADRQLAKLKEEHSQDSQRSTSLSQMLSDYASLAASLKDRIAKTDTEFDLSLIDEAIQLAALLTEKVKLDASRTEEAPKAILLRNQLLTLLTNRVGLTRKTAAYVFSQHPNIIREVTSDYERRRRNKARLEAKKEEAEKATGKSD